MIQSENFTPFMGVVENNNDKLGRLQVRVFGVHPRNKGKIPTEDLPWFSVVTSNSTGVSGIGHSIDYQKGSTVFGYMIGKDQQNGLILGSITGKPYSGPDGSKGFFDPDEKLPYYPPEESDVNRLAREPGGHWIIEKKNDTRVTSVETAAGETWEELPYNNQCIYPMNKVYETMEEHHVKEYDDTKGEERIHEWHKSGSYTEVVADGSRTVKVIGEGYELVMKDRNVYVVGNCNLTVDANCNTYVKGDWNIRVNGDINKEVFGNETVRIHGHNVKNVTDFIDYDSGKIYLN